MPRTQLRRGTQVYVMDREPRGLAILDLIDKAEEHGCNVGVMAIQIPGDEAIIELRFSKQGYHISKQLTRDQLTKSVIDVIAFEADVMIEQLEGRLASEAAQ